MLMFNCSGYRIRMETTRLDCVELVSLFLIKMTEMDDSGQIDLLWGMVIRSTRLMFHQGEEIGTVRSSEKRWNGF